VTTYSLLGADFFGWGERPDVASLFCLESLRVARLKIFAL